MKTKLFLPVVALCILCASPAFARIGETEAEIEARYGRSPGEVPGSEQSLTRAYGHAGLFIAVTFREGRSVLEMYRKQDRTAFTDTEIDVFMKANGGDRFVWMEEETKDPGVIRWRRAGPGLIMTYPSDRRSLFLCTEQFWKEAGQRMISKQTDKLKDI